MTTPLPERTEHPNGDESFAALPQAAQELLQSPNILDDIRDAMIARGLAGDPRPSLLTYLAITSRVLDRPINLSIVGSSGIGKNRKIDLARELHPSDAVHVVSAGSPRALIYNKESFQHRTIIMEEADSIPDEGAAASAVRALVFSQQMIYEVVTDATGKEGGGFTTKRITKEGPTGLITTSIQPLPPQLRTRVLQIELVEDPDEIRAVLRAVADEGEPSGRPHPGPYIRAQEWLQKHGTDRVSVPFRYAIANELQVTSAAIQRHFPMLLSATRAMAYLNQVQRERDEDGAVVADITDYAAVRDLLAPIFDASARDGITDTVRHTVLAVEEGERDVSVTELARRLSVAKSTASSRVAKAARGGWLVNEEWRKGFPARLRRSEPLPEMVDGLPSVERVREVFERPGCSGGEVAR